MLLMHKTKFAKQLKNIGLYFITDSTLTKLSVIRQVELAIEAGVKIVQYREKNLTELNRREIHATTAKIRELTKKSGVLFIVNDYVEDALEAEKLGADYIGVGPIYKTSTKKDAHPAIGIENLKEIRKNVKIPIIAIGGINRGNIVNVLKEKPDGAAIISGILCNPDIKKEMKDIIKIIGKNK